jgi:hypothetical protein
MPPPADVSTWEKITSIFTAVGGLGAMIGAGAAWRAALASGRASRDARDALAASLKPQVQLIVNQDGQGEPVVARAVVLGPLSPMGLAGVPASDVLIQFNLASGRHGSSESTPILEPNLSRSAFLGSAREPPYLNVVIGQPSDDWPSPEGDHATATVSFSDVRGAARYQRSTSTDLRRSAEPGLVSFLNYTEGIETRITP